MIDRVQLAGRLKWNWLLVFWFLFLFFPSQLKSEMPRRQMVAGSFILSSLVFVRHAFHALELSLFGVLFMVNNQRGAAACGIWRSALWCLGREGLTLGLLGQRGWGEGPHFISLSQTFVVHASIEFVTLLLSRIQGCKIIAQIKPHSSAVLKHFLWLKISWAVFFNRPPQLVNSTNNLHVNCPTGLDPSKDFFSAIKWFCYCRSALCFVFFLKIGCSR